MTINAFAAEKLLVVVHDPVRGGATGGAPKEPGYAETELYTIDPDSKKATKVFEDVATSITLIHQDGGSHFGVVADNKTVVGVAADDRRQSNSHNLKRAAYQLSIDQSNTIRKIVDINTVYHYEDFSMSFIIKPDGTEFGFEDDKFIHIFDTKEGKPLKKISISDIAGDMHIASIGWLRNKGKIFLTLDVCCEDEDENVGSYLIDETTQKLDKLSNSLISSFTGLQNISESILLCDFKDGSLLFKYCEWTGRKGKPNACYLVKVNNEKDFTKMDIESSNAYSFKISPSERWIAFVANGERIMVKDLNTGEEEEIFPIDKSAYGIGISYRNFIGIVGWVEE